MGSNGLPPEHKNTQATSPPPPLPVIEAHEPYPQKKSSTLDQLFDPFGIGLVVGSVIASEDSSSKRKEDEPRPNQD